MTFLIRTTKGYRRDYDLLRRRGFQMSRLDEAVRILSGEGRLPPAYYDHPLKGIWKDSGSAISQGIGSSCT